MDCTGAVVETCAQEEVCDSGVTCTNACDASLPASSAGCDFYSVQPAPDFENWGSCFAATVANTWISPAALAVEYDGATLDVEAFGRIIQGSGASLQYKPLTGGSLSPGEMAVLFLSVGLSGGGDAIQCPVAPALQGKLYVEGTGLGHAFRITSSVPVVAYDIYPYGGALSHISSATMLLPVPAWSLGYLAADAYEADPSLVTFGGLPFTQIVASQDATTVVIKSVADIVGGGGVQSASLGEALTLSLAQGELVQIAQPERLIGSTILADKPVGVWGGSGCMRIPVGVPACDSAHQQLLPINSLGSSYVAAPFRNRVTGLDEDIRYTILGATDGTELGYDPIAPVGAPLVLQRGESFEISANEAFSVRSQDSAHPFYIAAHMTAGLPAANMGDPEFVNVVPSGQFLSKYIFLTDPTYGNTHLVFVRPVPKPGEEPAAVQLECALIGGWQPVGAKGEWEYAQFDVMVGGAANGGCENGVHVAQAETPFGLTVWGWDTFVSYAFPAGAGALRLNEVSIAR